MDRLRASLPALLGALIFGAALFVLRRELAGVRYHTLSTSVLSLPPSALLLAFVLTAANYAVLTAYDQLSFVYIGKKVDRWRISAASFLAYAVANNVGFAMVSGASVRYRFYSRWGTTPAELSRIVLFYSITFWIGLLVLAGGSLVLHPGLGDLPTEAWARPLGFLLLAIAVAYAAFPFVRRTPVRLFGLEIAPPRPRLVAAQFAVSILDWILAAATLFVLLPPGRVGFFKALRSFLTAQLLGLVSHVPGGLGVFESTMVLLLKPSFTAADLLPSLLSYRAIYYLAPLAAALAVLAVDEARERRATLARARDVFGALTQEITPRVLAIFIFLAGTVLLFSGATPAAVGRLAWLGRVLPLGLVEVSHFVGSLVGVCLLIVSQGVSRRLDVAFYLAVSGLAAGIVASLLKGVGLEEAFFLALTLVALLVSRKRFDRPAAFFETRFSAGWIVAVICVVGAAVWLGLFSFKHVEYSNDLWWQFELKREVSRFLRASVGASVALMTFGAARLMRPAPPELLLPTDTDLADAERAIASQDAASPNLVFLRDKAVLWDAGRSGFVMYGVQGRTWVALGDPVGPPEAATALIRDFLERADDYGADGVFYEVSQGRLHLYADFGLTFVKVGEHAHVPLASFTVEGSERKALRNAVTRVSREGGRFRVIPAPAVAEVLPALREVSDAWMDQHRAAEKGFSLGFFDPEYVARFPVAVIERGGKIEAFAGLWPGPGGVELAVDLMRFRPSGPKNVMEALFVQVMLWGRDQGYRRFAMGTAPLSGFERSPVAPLWLRLGRFLYSHGEALYNFQGLRAYKEKFHPVWEARYLAYPGGMALPRVLADVAALIAGGYRRIFAK